MRGDISRRQKGSFNWLMLLTGLIVFAVVPFFLKSYQQNTFILIAFYAFAATAWNIICGFVGTLSLGHAAYLGLGGYISTLLLIYLDLSPWIGMFVGAFITCLIGIGVGYLCFRLKGPYFSLTSIAFAEILRIWVENNEYFFGIDIQGSMGLLLQQTGFQASAFEFEGKLAYYCVIMAFLAIAVLISFYIRRNKLGFYMVAIRSDPDAAESLGIPLLKYKLIAMAISVFLIAFAGTFYAQYFRYIGPTRVFGRDLSIQIALPALVGGQGTVLGPLFGAILLVPVTEYLSMHLSGTMPGLHLFVYGIVMMLVVFFMPKGIHDYVIRFFNWAQNALTGEGKKVAR